MAYLVRRLLENGANSSFVNRIADAEVSLDELVRDPVADLAVIEPKKNPNIPLPRDIFGPARHNSAGVDLSDPLVREPLLERLAVLETKTWSAAPGIGKGKARDVTSPTDRSRVVGIVREAGAKDVDAMVRTAAAVQVEWDMVGGEGRAALLDRTADLFEEHADDFFSLCIREAGKTLVDAVLELREAVDFLRFYASEARRQFTAPIRLPGPTGA